MKMCINMNYVPNLFLSYHAMPYHTIPSYHTIPYHTIPYHTIQVIDGGSTGSRLHIFEFQKNPSNNHTSCVRLGSHKSEIPLSSFARNIIPVPIHEHKGNNFLNSTSTHINNVNMNVNANVNVAEHLLPSFQYAAQIIPSEFHKTTSVHYQATAGMRLIHPLEQERVYDAMYKGLLESSSSSSSKSRGRGGGDESEFSFPFVSLQRKDIATLGGEEEALYGAVAANYLKGVVDVNLNMNTNTNRNTNTNTKTNSNRKNNDEDMEDIEFDGPLGALDMGGASMQIVYLPHEEFFEGDEETDANNSNTTTTTNNTSNVDTDELGEGHKESVEEDMVELPNLRPPNRLNGDEFFSTSYLSYGADQMRERLWNTWVDKRERSESESRSRNGNIEIEIEIGSDEDEKIIENPCSFKGYELEWRGYILKGMGDAKMCADQVNRLIPHHVGHTSNDSVDVDVDGTSSFDGHSDSDAKIVGGVEHPPIRGQFFAMSLFFFTLDCLRELSQLESLNESWPTPSIADLTDALDLLCSRKWHGVSECECEYECSNQNNALDKR